MATGNITTYEWTAEGIDENGDVDDIHFASSYAEAVAAAARLAEDYARADVGITRRVHDWTGELVSEQWAYVCDGELETEFDGGAKVPAKFIAEFRKFSR